MRPGDDPLPDAQGPTMNLLRAMPGRIRAIVRRFSGLFRFALIFGNLLGLVGFFVRDRSVLLASLLYLPLLPIGALTVGLGFLDRWRLRRTGWGLIVIGLASVLSGSWWMIGRGASPGASVREDVNILHWNVLWGGFWRSNQTLWNSMVDDIIARDPDIVVLSEAPPRPEMYAGFERLPGHRFSLSVWNLNSVEHESHIHLISRWPLHLAGPVGIVHGAAGMVVIDHPAQPIRLMVVDGQSQIHRLRTPMLHDIAEACDRMAERGEPVDLIVGDFNAVSRSIGFDEVSRAASGYHLASRSCLGWRGTWPSFFPVFDIDHIWVRSGWTILGDRLFTNFGTDHRGQWAHLSLTGSVRSPAWSPVEAVTE